MKLILTYLLFTALVCYSFAQQESDIIAIDSIRNNYLQSNIKDSLVIANAHYEIGEIYRYNFLGDSAYFHYHKAVKIYNRLNNKYKKALTLYGIAVIQKDEKDFTGSEVNSIEAIALLESLEESNNVIRYKSFLCNNLGLVFDQLELYDESISYHKKALALKAKLKGDITSTVDNSKNNLALSYKNSGNYALALKYYAEILENKNLINERPEFYALVLDNYAHSLFLSKDYQLLPGLYLRAMKICDSLNNATSSYTTISINQNLAEYYNEINKKDSARHYAYEAKNISDHYYNDDLLRSLLLLSKIEEGEKSAQHLEAYIKLSDSLQKAERSIRNKFARIRFETDQLEQENVQIARERLWLLIISIVLIISSFLIYVIITQRNKNKELQFIQRQQEANEEIYNLMLSQNESIEEARTLEKQRISQELHDGVLGRLFGTRLSLDSLNMNPSPDAVKTRAQYIDELKTIEQDIRKVSHELNTDFVSGSGFIDIIKTLIETQTNVYNLEYDLDYADAINWDSVSNKKKIHIYRLLQESLHNIYKHANATHVKISFKLKNSVICLIIEDDGSGFDVNKAKSGIGLKNMNARIEEINGKIEITSEKEKGTQVSIEVPIP